MTDAQHLVFAAEWTLVGVALSLWAQSVLRRALGRPCPACERMRLAAGAYGEARRPGPPSGPW